MNLLGIEIPLENPNKAVRADMVKGIMFLEYIDENSCCLSGLVNINPRIQYIPRLLINYVVKRIVYDTLCRLSKKEFYECEEVKIKIKENEQFLEYVENKLNDITN